MPIVQRPRRKPWALSRLVLGSAAACFAMTAQAAPMTPGIWGGDQANLSIDGQRVRIQLDCGAFTLDGPPTPDASGDFTTRGTYEDYAAGPQSGDAVAATRAVTGQGTVAGDTLRLSLQIDGEKEARRYTLARGKKSKVVRCM